MLSLPAIPILLLCTSWSTVTLSNGRTSHIQIWANQSPSSFLCYAISTLVVLMISWNLLTFFAWVSPVIRLQSKPAQLTVRDVGIVIDTKDGEPEFSGPGGYDSLTFDNVWYSLHKEGGWVPSQRGAPKYLDVECELYVELCRYAKKTCILPPRTGKLGFP
jgi:hypothetical protein